MQLFKMEKTIAGMAELIHLFVRWRNDWAHHENRTFFRIQYYHHCSLNWSMSTRFFN